jgi:hypothetical protein
MEPVQQATKRNRLIDCRRPDGIGVASRLGRLIRRLDRATLAYRVQANPSRMLCGWGHLAVQVAEDRIWCRVLGEVQRPNPYEFLLQSFWLTRRGIAVTLINALEGRNPGDRPAEEHFIQPVDLERPVKTEIRDWIERRFKGAQR